VNLLFLFFSFTSFRHSVYAATVLDFLQPTLKAETFARSLLALGLLEADKSETKASSDPLSEGIKSTNGVQKAGACLHYRAWAISTMEPTRDKEEKRKQ